MSDINIIVVSGNLTKDPEYSVTNGGKASYKFDVACNKKWKDQQSTTFFRCVMWENNQGALSWVPTAIKTGTKVTVTGEMSIVNKQVNGVWKTYTNIVVNNLSNGGSSDQQNGNQQQQPNQNNQQHNPHSITPPHQQGSVANQYQQQQSFQQSGPQGGAIPEDFDDDIPF